MKIRPIVINLFIISFFVSNISAQTTGVINTVIRPPAPKRHSPFIIYTKGIETLPMGKSIIADLGRLPYVTLQNNVNRNWSLRIKPNLDRSMIVIERSGFWKVDELPLNAAGLRKTVIEIVKREAAWQAVKLLKNNNPSSKVKIEMRIIPEPGTEAADVVRMKKGDLREKDYFQFQIRNVGTVRAYITIIDLLADGQMKILCPITRVDPANSVPPDKKWYVVPEGQDYVITPPVGGESFQVLATDKPVFLSGRYIPSLLETGRRPAYNALGQYFADLPNSSVRAPAGGDWTTATLSFDVGQPRTLHVLSVGISKYDKRSAIKAFKGGAGNLGNVNSGNDVRDFSSLLEEYGRHVFSRINVKVLSEKDATKKAIVAAFREIIAQSKPQDTFVFQFSGRYVQIKDNQVVIVPSDYNPANLLSSSIPTQFLQTYLSQIQASHQFILLDGAVSAKGAGNFIDRLKLENAEFAGLIQRDIWVLETDETSTGAKPEENQKGYGPLSFSIIEGMNGAADLDTNGEITVAELFNYSEISIKDTNKLWKTGNDFVLLETPLKKKKVTANFSSQPRWSPVSFTYTGREQQINEDQTGAGYTPRATPTPTEEGAAVRAEIVGSPQTTQPNYVRKGKDYALLVGTDVYDQWGQLSNPVYDIKAVAEQLKDHYGFDINLETDVLENPTRQDVLDALKRLKAREYQPDDQLFLFFAGHGYYNENLNAGFLVFKDGKALDRTDILCGSCDTYLRHSDLGNILNNIKNCQHIFVVIDSCFSGTFSYFTANHPANENFHDLAINRNGNGDLYDELNKDQMMERIMQFKTRISLTSGGKEYVPDGRPGQHSPFARRFLKALETCDTDFGLVTFNDVISSVQRLTPMPRRGVWGDNDDDSNFAFGCKKQP